MQFLDKEATEYFLGPSLRLQEGGGLVHNLASERRAGGVALIDNDLLIAFKSQAGVPTSAPAPHLGNLTLILHFQEKQLHNVYSVWCKA